MKDDERRPAFELTVSCETIEDFAALYVAVFRWMYREAGRPDIPGWRSHAERRQMRDAEIRRLLTSAELAGFSGRKAAQVLTRKFNRHPDRFPALQIYTGGRSLSVRTVRRLHSAFNRVGQPPR